MPKNRRIRELYTNFLVNDTFQVDNISIDAAALAGGYTYSAYQEGTFSVSKSGYTPVAVAGSNCANATSGGQNVTSTVLIRSYIDSDEVYHWRIANRCGAAAVVRLLVYILYAKKLS